MPADQSPGGNNNRWGISTKEPVEDEEDNTDKQQTPKKVANDAETKSQPISKPQQSPVQDVKKKPAPKGDESVSAADSKETQKPGTSKPYKHPDRPWIIKEEHMKQTPAPAETSRAVKWKNDKQQSKCESNLKQIRENFLRARYYSMQGDFCLTANYAKAFIRLVEVCKQNCPDKLLEHHGYSKRIIRNLNWLEELGSKQCLGRKMTTKMEEKN
jgi:hypothetical protein